MMATELDIIIICNDLIMTDFKNTKSVRGQNSSCLGRGKENGADMGWTYKEVHLAVHIESKGAKIVIFQKHCTKSGLRKIEAKWWRTHRTEDDIMQMLLKTTLP